jgi:hypothetical protein
MAAFNLTAQLNITGPNNLKPVISNLRKQLGTVNGNVNIQISPTVASAASGLNSSLKALDSTLKQINSSASSASSAFRQLGTAIRSVDVRSVPKDIAAVTQQSQRLQSQQAKTTASITDSSNSMVEFGKQSALAIRRFAAFSLVTGVIFKFTNALGQASSEFIKFNSQLVQLSQVTGTSLKGLEGLEQTITALSTSLGVSSSSLIDVSSTLAQAGLSANETEEALKALAKSVLAPSFGNLNETVEGSIALMRQFSISTAQLEAALGSINSVAAKFAVEADDIIVAIQRTGGVFAAASKGVVENSEALNQFIALFTSVRATTRESAETIATGLRTIFTRIQRKDTIDLLKQYGIELTDLEGKFVGPYEAVKRLSRGLAGLDTRDIRFSSIIEELGGFRQVGKVIPLLQQFSTAERALMTAQRGQGSLTADAAKAQQALAIQMAKVQQEFIALVRSIGSSNQFQTMVKVALDLASALISVADASKHAMPAIAGLLAVKGTIGAFRFASGFASGMRRGGGGPGGGPGTRMSGAPRGYAQGGQVPVALEAGEMVFVGESAKKAGYGNLRRLNRAGDRPNSSVALNRAGGGGIFMVPGSGRGDNFRTTLPEGSFVIKRKSVRAIGAENIAQMASNGGAIRYALGGKIQRLSSGTDKPVKVGKTNASGSVFMHLDPGPIIKDLFGRGSRNARGLTNIGITLGKEGPVWNQLLKKNNANISKEQFLSLIQGTSPEELFSQQLQISRNGKKVRPGAGTFRGGTSSEAYNLLSDPKVLSNLKDALLASASKLRYPIRGDKDLFPLGKAMIDAAPAVLKKGFSEIREIVYTDTEKGRKRRAEAVKQAAEKGEKVKRTTSEVRKRYTDSMRKRAETGDLRVVYQRGGKGRRYHAIGGLIQRLSGGSDKPLQNMGRSELIAESKKLGINFGSIASWSDLGNRGDIGSQARSKLIAQLEEARTLRKTSQAETSVRAKRTNVAVIGAMAPAGIRGSSTEVMIPGARDRKTGRRIKDTPATLHIGALEGKTAARVTAVIRNQTARITQKVMKIIAQEAGMILPKDNVSKLKRKPIHSGIAGGLLEQAILGLMGIDKPLGSIDLGASGLSPELAKVFGIPQAAGVPTDITYGGEGGRTLAEAAKRKAVGKSRNSKGQRTSSQIGRGLASLRASQNRAMGGIIQKFANGGKLSRSTYKLVPNEKGVGASPFGSTKSNRLGQEFFDLLNRSGLPKWEHNQVLDFLKTNQYNLQEAKAYIQKRTEERSRKLSLKTNVTSLTDSLRTTTGPTPRQLELAQQLKRYGGGEIPFQPDQFFAKGGGIKSKQPAVRNVGWIDSDFLRNSPKAKAEMERLGVNLDEYKRILTEEAIKARKSGGLSRLTTVVGSPGSGKSSFAEGNQRTQISDNATLRKTNRFPIETLGDVSKANSIIDTAASVSPDRLVDLNHSDRVIALSSSTKEEQKILKKQLRHRTATGEKQYGRTHTITAQDSGETEAMLQMGLRDKSKLVTLGLLPNFKKRIKRQNELPIVKEEQISLGFGSFSPPTKAGHDQGLMSNAKHKKLVLVGPNEPVGTDIHSARTALLPQEFRHKLAQKAFPDAYVSKKTSGFAIPHVFDVGKDPETGRRLFIRRAKGSEALVAGKDEKSLKKYQEAGFGVREIPRDPNGESGTAARERILRGDFSGFHPEVEKDLKSRAGQLANRQQILPRIIDKTQSRTNKQVSEIEKALTAYPSRITEKIRTEQPGIVEAIESLRAKKTSLKSKAGSRPHLVLARLARRYPERYGLAQGGMPPKPQKQFGKIGLRSSGHEITAFYFKNNVREGFVTAKEIEKGIWNIGLSKATKGYGPRLYDAVMEAVTARGGVLTSHRGKVSQHAKKVWDTYANERSQPNNKYGSQVTKIPLDAKHHTIDKDPNSSLNYGYQQQPNIIKGSDIVDMNDEKYTPFLKHMQFEFLKANGGPIQRFAGGSLRPIRRKPVVAQTSRTQSSGGELLAIQSQIDDLNARRQVLASHTKTSFFGSKQNPYQTEIHKLEDEIDRLSQRKYRLSQQSTPPSAKPITSTSKPALVTATRPSTPIQTKQAAIQSKVSPKPGSITVVLNRQQKLELKDTIKRLDKEIQDAESGIQTFRSHDIKPGFFGKLTGQSVKNPYQQQIWEAEERKTRAETQKRRLLEQYGSQLNESRSFAIGGEIPIMAQEGEFVINKHAAGQIGHHTLRKLNRGGKVAAQTLAKLPKYHSGGSVQKLAAGGVIDQALSGMSPRDAAKLRASIQANSAAFEKLEKGVEKWPINDVQAAMKKLARTIEKGGSEIDLKPLKHITSSTDTIKKNDKDKAEFEKNAKKAAVKSGASATEASKIAKEETAVKFASKQQKIEKWKSDNGLVTAKQEKKERVGPTPYGPASPKSREITSSANFEANRAKTVQDLQDFEKNKYQEARKSGKTATEAKTYARNEVLERTKTLAKPMSKKEEKLVAGQAYGRAREAGASKEEAQRSASQALEQAKQNRKSQSQGAAIYAGAVSTGQDPHKALANAGRGDITVAPQKKNYIERNNARAEQYSTTATKFKNKASSMAAGGTSGSAILATANKAFAPIVAGASKVAGGMARLHSGAASLAGGLSKASGGVGSFAATLRSNPTKALSQAVGGAVNSIIKLAKGADSAVGSLMGMKKVDIGGGKQGWRSTGNGIMGRVGGFFGMGGGGGQMGDDGVTRGPDGKRKRGFGKGGRGGGGGGMGGMGMYAAEMGISMLGSAGVEYFSKAAGGDKSKEGRQISTIGGSAVSGASMGMMMGSAFGPLGMAAGAAIGGIGGALYGQSQMPEIERQAASQKRMETIDKARGKMSQDLSIAANTQAPEKTRKEAEARAQANFTTIASASREEAVAGAKKKERTWAEWSAGVGPSSAKTVDERVESAQPAADAAKEMLMAKMQKTGKTLEELESSMPRSEFNQLSESIALTDKGYQSLLEAVYADGKVTDAEAKTLESARKAAMERQGADLKAAGEAAKLAKENAKASKAAQKVSTSFERMADALNSAAAKADKIMENGKLGIEAIDNPSAALQQGQISKSADILSNPNAYSINEVEQAARQNAGMAGSSSEAMVQSAVLPRKLEQSFGSAVKEATASGKDDSETRSSVKDAMNKTVEQAFGPDISASMKEKISTFVDGFEGDISQLDFNDLLKAVPELADKIAASGKVMEALKAQAQTAANAIAMMSDAAQKGASKDQEVRNNNADTFSTIANSTLAFRRGTGEKISWQADAAVRTQSRAMRLGTTPDVAASPKAMLNRYNQLKTATNQAAENQQQVNEASRPALMSGDPNAVKGATGAMAAAANATAQFAQSTKQARDEIMALPNDIKDNISGIMQELQDVMQERAAKLGAAGGFMEKVLTSTPQDLKKMGNTFNNLNRTLSGKGVSFQESYSANKAYNQVRNQGGSHQQAQRAAQEAYAQESGDTISMAKELAPLLGAVDPDAQSKMMGSVYESMFAARGIDTSQMKIGDKSMKDYIDMMKKGAKEDPKVKALQDALAGQQAALKEAAATANTVLMNEKEEIIAKTGVVIEDAMIKGAEAVKKAMEEAKIAGITAPGEVGKDKPGDPGKPALTPEETKERVAKNKAEIEEAKKARASAVTDEDKQKAERTIREKEQENAVLTGDAKGKKHLTASASGMNYEEHALPGESEEDFAKRKQSLIEMVDGVPPSKPSTPTTPTQNAAANQAATPTPTTAANTNGSASSPPRRTAVDNSDPNVAYSGVPGAVSKPDDFTTGNAQTPAQQRQAIAASAPKPGVQRPTVYGSSNVDMFGNTQITDPSQAAAQSYANLQTEQQVAGMVGEAATNMANVNNAPPTQAITPTQQQQPSRPGPMGLQNVHKEAYIRGMSAEEVRSERQQQYLSRLNPETRARMEKKLGVTYQPQGVQAGAAAGMAGQVPPSAPSVPQGTGETLPPQIPQPRQGSGAYTPPASSGAPVSAPRAVPTSSGQQNQGAGVLNTSGLEAFAGKLDSLLTQLAAVNIPTEIRLTSENLGVNVTLNGGEVMANLPEQLKNTILAQAGEQLKNYDRNGSGEGTASKPGVIPGKNIA